jgi:predicted Zn-dependent protease
MIDQNLREMLLTVRDRAAERGVAASLALHRERSHLMRIGNNSVSLNTSETLTRLDVEVVDGRRQGTHTHVGALTTAAEVQAALDLAIQKAVLAAPKDYDPPVAVVEEPVDEGAQHDAALAELDPAVKADVYRQIFAEVGPAYNYSGAWSSGLTEQYLVTTANRNEAWHVGTDQQMTVVLKHPEQKWELSHTGTGWRAGDVTADAAVSGLRALLPVYESQPGFRVEPGAYTVVFGAEALSLILGLALWTGFSGRGWQEKWGWTAQRAIGDGVLGGNVSLADDPLDPRSFGIGFDMTGKRRRRFSLVENGRLAGLMWDANGAAKYGQQATGHDTGSLSIAMRTGDGPTDPLEAVRGMGQVLYIPALHYGNVPNPSQGVFTASSRFSAVLVEGGRITRPLFSSRVTDSFANVLGNVAVIASEAVSVNTSDTYGRRSPNAMSLPAYVVCEGVKITDCAESF